MRERHNIEWSDVDNKESVFKMLCDKEIAKRAKGEVEVITKEIESDDEEEDASLLPMTTCSQALVYVDGLLDYLEC